MKPEEAQLFISKRRSRNIALALTLGALVVIFFSITIIRMMK